MGAALVKIVLTQQGDSTTHTYGIDTTNRILNINHAEQEWSQTAEVQVSNRDGNLTALTLEGYLGVISWGYKDITQGDEYSATAPLTVISQKTDSLGGEVVSSFSLAGLFNLWGEQEATEAYTPDRINSDTVKTILDAIAGATLTCFNTYPAHTITYDSGYDDSIINAFTPADSFSIAKGESRRSAYKKALGYTKCKSRVENDAGTATPHIFQPLITGSNYDYEYKNAWGVTNHTFFNKSVRTRLVLPNKVVAMNHPDHDDTYTGNATDAASYAALGDQYYTKTVYVRASSNAQCALIATAVLQRFQIAAEKGHGLAPMNVGQEVMDYVKITDSRTSDSRVGNIGYLNRWYSFAPKLPTRFGIEIRFGSLLQPGLAGTILPSALDVGAPGTEGQTSASKILALQNAYLDLFTFVQQISDYLIAQQESLEFQRLSVVERFQGPMGTDKYD